jgi:hypothetical protein
MQCPFSSLKEWIAGNLCHTIQPVTRFWEAGASCASGGCKNTIFSAFGKKEPPAFVQHKLKKTRQ